MIQARRCGTTLQVKNEVEKPERTTTDRYKFTQVLRNMISNALKFTPAGGTITVVIKEGNGGLRENDSWPKKMSDCTAWRQKVPRGIQRECHVAMHSR